MRACSLLPSATEMLFAMGAGQVYGVDGRRPFRGRGRLVDGLEILWAIVSGAGWERLPAKSVARLA